jgi:carbon storage regulator
MLILSRKLNESIIIDGRIIVKVLRIERDTVKLGIQAPPELPVHRQEIYDAIQRSKEGVTPDALAGHLLSSSIPRAPASGSPSPAPQPSRPPDD